MLITQSYCPKDLEQAQRSAEWLRELGGAKGHSLLLIEDDRITVADSIAPIYRESFDTVEVLRFKDHYDKWPDSPSEVFATAARHIGDNHPQPWLWHEPDSICLVPGAFDALWNEYQRAGKLFMGAFVRGVNGGLDHQSGIGIYPGELVKHAGMALIANDQPFDIAAASQITPKAHFTNLIFHHWKGLAFESIEDLREMIGPEPVLYHSEKTPKLIDLLRAEKNLPVPSLADVPVMGGIARESDSDERNALPVTPAARNRPRGGQSFEEKGGDEISQRLKEKSDSATTHSVQSTPDQSNVAPNVQPIGAAQVLVPWANKKESLAYIRWLATELKKFCTAPRSTLVVRQELRQIRVITKVR